MTHTINLGTDTLGNITRIDNCIDHLADNLEKAEKNLAETEKQLQIAKESLKEPFSREEELQEKQTRLNELNALLNVDKRDNEFCDEEPDESEIKQSNRNLNQMFDANVGYYHELVKYILAGEQGCKELENYIAQRQQDYENTADNAIQLEISSLNNALMMLEQRTQDLRTAENIAMQTIPMIKTMEYSNMNLVRKINSAFIVTLPVFKQALAQAIMLKRQKIQAEAMSELDKKTNEMLIKNAKNTVEQSKMTAKLASGSSIKIDTLEKTWRTIVNGIDETRAIQENARKQRIDDAARLDQIKKEFMETYGGAVKR